VRQYQKLFEFENVRLKFSDEALDAIAMLAMERKVGARGLRMILEDLMLDLMYYLPSYKKVREFQVTKEMVLSQKISLTLLEKAGYRHRQSSLCPPSLPPRGSCSLLKNDPKQNACR
jgi:ATP-dependent Clp protease ATP-binding subunit ClpX